MESRQRKLDQLQRDSVCREGHRSWRETVSVLSESHGVSAVVGSIFTTHGRRGKSEKQGQDNRCYHMVRDKRQQ